MKLRDVNRQSKPLGYPIHLASKDARDGISGAPISKWLFMPMWFEHTCPEKLALYEWARRTMPDASPWAHNVFVEMWWSATAYECKKRFASLKAIREVPESVLARAILKAITKNEKAVQAWRFHSEAVGNGVPELLLWHLADIFEPDSPTPPAPLPPPPPGKGIPGDSDEEPAEPPYWLPIRVESPPLEDRLVHRAPVGLSYCGVTPHPARAATGKLGYKCFKRKKRVRGRRIAVALDCSGSMKFESMKLIDYVASYTNLLDVFAYASQESEGVVYHIVRDGVRVKDIERYTKEHPCWQNEADMTVLQWIQEHYPNHRRIWVSDTYAWPANTHVFKLTQLMLNVALANRMGFEVCTTMEQLRGALR